jgi:hypothetical protein
MSGTTITAPPGSIGNVTIIPFDAVDMTGTWYFGHQLLP